MEKRIFEKFAEGLMKQGIMGFGWLNDFMHTSATCIYQSRKKKQKHKITELLVNHRKCRKYLIGSRQAYMWSKSQKEKVCLFNLTGFLMNQKKLKILAIKKSCHSIMWQYRYWLHVWNLGLRLKWFSKNWLHVWNEMVFN